MKENQNNNIILCIFYAITWVFALSGIILVLISEFLLAKSHSSVTDFVQNILLIFFTALFVISRSKLDKNIKKDLIIFGFLGIIGVLISNFLLRINGSHLQYYGQYAVLILSLISIVIGFIKVGENAQKALIIFGFLCILAVLASEFMLKAYQIDFAQEVILIFSTMLIVTCIENLKQRENEQKDKS